MGADIFTAAIPEPYRILGLKLKPLSIGRYQRLRRFNVAFVSEEIVSATIEDLLTGVLICSMQCRDFDALIDGPSFNSEMRRWGKRIRKEISLPGFSIIEKVQLFNQYINEAQEIPEFWNESEDTEPSGSHWCHAMEVALRSEVGWTREEIEEAPFSKAVYDWLKWAESQGAIRICAEGENQFAESNSKALADLMKGVLCQASN